MFIGKRTSSSSSSKKSTSLLQNKRASLPASTNNEKNSDATSNSASKFSKNAKDRKLSHPRIKYSGVKNLSGNSGGGGSVVVNNVGGTAAAVAAVTGVVTASNIPSILSGNSAVTLNSVHAATGVISGGNICPPRGNSNCENTVTAPSATANTSGICTNAITSSAAISQIPSISSMSSINSLANIISKATASSNSVLSNSALSNPVRSDPVMSEPIILSNTILKASNHKELSDRSLKTELVTVPPPSIATISIPLPPPLKPAPGVVNKPTLPAAYIEEYVKYADIDDIELPDGTKIGYPSDLAELKRLQAMPNFFPPDAVVDKLSTMKQLSMLAAAKAMHDSMSGSDLELSLNQSNNDDLEIYACRHCGKKYRWKSTLRRHENDECGGKEPAHTCPYCPYKAKQRGNLGVHVRKHHADKPQLESRRKKRSSY